MIEGTIIKAWYWLFSFLIFIVSTTFGEEQKKAKVVLIGIDGLTHNLVTPYLKKGYLPNINALIKNGGIGYLNSFWPLRTMQVWTSIATGKMPGQHGIWDHAKHTAFNPSEIRTKENEYYLSSDRQSKALWQILGEKNVSSTFVGWTTTWPAEKIPRGIIVAPKVLYGDDRRTTIKGSFWKHVAQSVAPIQYESLVKNHITEPSDISDDDLTILATVPSTNSPLYTLPKIKSYVYTLRWGLARSKSAEDITLALFEKNPTDLVSVYFQGTDSYLHRFWIFQKSVDEIKERLKQFNIQSKYSASLKKHFGDVVANCYKEIDDRVGRILKKTKGPNTLVLLVSDHGFGDGAKRHPFTAEPYGGIHWSKALIIAAGPTIKKGTVIKDASVLGIVPTLLHYFSLPVAKDMQGKVIKSIFNASPELQKPVKWVETYEQQPQIEIPFKKYHIKPKSFIW